MQQIATTQITFEDRTFRLNLFLYLGDRFHFLSRFFIREIEIGAGKYDGNGVGVLLEVGVVHVVVLDRVGVGVGGVALLEALFNVGDTPGRDDQVGGKHDQHDALDPSLVQGSTQMVPRIKEKMFNGTYF